MQDKNISNAGFIKYQDQYLTLMHYKEPLTEIKDGFGYYGCLLSTVDGDKVQCAICGGLYSELSKHITPKHGLTAREYKEKYGLAYQTSLISEKVRAARKERTLSWIKSMEEKHGINWRGVLISHSKKGNQNRHNKRHQPQITLETKNKRGTCPDQLLAKIQEVKEKLGRTPSKSEFIVETGTQRYVHLIYKTFGSWVNAIEKLGLHPKQHSGAQTNKGNQYKPYYSEEELLEYLRVFYKENKKIPTETDCRRGLVPPSSAYTRHFGSLPIARERAGIFEKPTKWGVLVT